MPHFGLLFRRRLLNAGCRRRQVAGDCRGATGEVSVAEIFDKDTFVHLMFRCVNAYEIDFACSIRA
jgi:hypothetical protein